MLSRCPVQVLHFNEPESSDTIGERLQNARH
jgi:hypothetical protein